MSKLKTEVPVEDNKLYSKFKKSAVVHFLGCLCVLIIFSVYEILTCMQKEDEFIKVQGTDLSIKDLKDTTTNTVTERTLQETTFSCNGRIYTLVTEYNPISTYESAVLYAFDTGDNQANKCEHDNSGKFAWLNKMYILPDEPVTYEGSCFYELSKGIFTMTCFTTGDTESEEMFTDMSYVLNLVGGEIYDLFEEQKVLK